MSPKQQIVYQRPRLYQKQREAIFCSQRYGLIEASTKTGKTTGCLVWLAEQAMAGKDGQNYWWVAPIYAQAIIAFRRLKRMLPKHLYVTNESDHTLTWLPTGTIIWFKGADKPDSLYAEDVYAAVIDEASRVKEEAWHAIRSTLTFTRGPIRFIGNVKGRKNWFYRMSRKAEAGADNMHYAKLIAYDAVAAGVLAADEIEDARSVLPEAVFKELYLAEPNDDGGNPFGLAAIQKCIKPLSMRPAEFWGWDLAKSVDWTVGIGLDAAGGTSRFERFQLPWPRTIDTIKSLTGDTPAMYDSTGVGDPVGEIIQLEAGNFEGFKFTSKSKQQLMEGLAVAIQNGQVSFPEGHIVNELELFEYAYTRTGVKYCMVPSTKILTQSLHWRPLSEMRIGDKILAFDEYPTENEDRKWRTATITAHEVIKRPCYEIILEDGTKLTASQEHLWLIDVGNSGEDGSTHQWMRTDELRGVHPTSNSLRFSPHHLSKVLDVWKEDKSYEAGYLAGVFDGEGNISQPKKHGGKGHGARISFSQRENALAKLCRQYLKEKRFKWAENKGNGTNKDVVSFGITGRRAEVLRLLGQIRPKRLLENFDLEKLGVFYKKEKVKIVRIDFVGEKDVIALGTSTHTFIAEGYATHNSAPEGYHDDCVCGLALAVRRMSIPVLGIGFLHHYADESKRIQEQREALEQAGKHDYHHVTTTHQKD